MRFAAVSTFNREGLDLYGRRMVATFLDHWPIEVPLTVYTEGFGADALPAGVNALGLHEASGWLTAFKQRNKNRKFRDYRWDAVRFAHKVAAVCHFARTTEADVMIWIDGDVVTHSPITTDDLVGLAPKGDEWIAWLDRDNVYPECGWYMLNRRHPSHWPLIDAFVGLYVDDKVYDLPECHDSYVLEHVVRRSNVGRKSLSGAGRKTTHPLVNGPLGAWFDHLKGPRKQAGRSRPGDVKVPRSEAYWK